MMGAWVEFNAGGGLWRVLTCIHGDGGAAVLGGSLLWVLLVAVWRGLRQVKTHSLWQENGSKLTLKHMTSVSHGDIQCIQTEHRSFRLRVYLYSLLNLLQLFSM